MENETTRPWHWSPKKRWQSIRSYCTGIRCIGTCVRLSTILASKGGIATKTSSLIVCVSFVVCGLWRVVRWHLFFKNNLFLGCFFFIFLCSASEISDEAWLLCFDEFQVTDVADALIMTKLFGTMWRNGTVVVATSNRRPNELYENGLNRHYFIEIIF